MRPTFAALILLAGLQAPLTAQQTAAPADVESPQAIVKAAYDALARAPGQPFQWDRFRSLFLPEARLIPNTEQTQGRFTVHTVESFISWIDAGWKNVIGTANDRGFSEDEVKSHVEQYGDIAHAFSTYEKHIWKDPEVRGRGVNSFQMVKKDGRWWITGIVWDEETGAGPVPARYRPPS
jgi:hypothetical protein